MFTTKTMKLLFAKLPKADREAHLATGIINNFLYVSVLCDAGCEVFFHSTGYEISFNGEIIIIGWRDMQTNMWRIYLLYEGVSNIITAYRDGAMMPELWPMPLTEVFSNNTYACDTTGQFIQFYHATMGYLCTSNWCKAITAGYFKVRPGLTAARVHHFIKLLKETKMGHMYQQRQGTRSTNPFHIKTDTMEEVP